MSSTPHNTDDPHGTGAPASGGEEAHGAPAKRGRTCGTRRKSALRRRLYEILEGTASHDRTARAFEMFIVTLIVLNVAAFVAETVPSLHRAYGPLFYQFETISVAIFTVEYLVRLWTAIETPFFARLSPARARLRAASRPDMLIDLAAIAPFYLAQLFSIDLRVLRVLRLLRFLKLSRYSPAMHTLIRVLVNERRALLGAGLLLLAALLFASTGIYYLESDAQPDKFGSVPEAAWWAIATLTTVGYGDVAPVTALGRAFGALVMVTGLCVLALPVAIIATGFSQEVGRRDFVVNWSLMSRIPMLAELDARDVGHIMPMLHAHNVPANFELIGKGSDGTAMYFIASGKVRLDTAHGVEEFDSGDCFGVEALLDNDIHPGAFVTSSKCRLLKLYRHDFHQLERLSPTVARHLRKLAERRRAMRAARAAEDEAAD